MSWKVRTELLIGNDKSNALKNFHVLVVGLGGVGSAAAEMIARAGIGNMTIVDGDTVDPSNINRQLPATHNTIGAPKANLVGARLMDINPELNLNIIQKYFTNEEMEQLFTVNYDYVIDAIDTLSPKVQLLVEAFNRNIPTVCSLGAGGKLHPDKVEIVDISKTYNCNLGKVLRKHLHRKGIRKGIKAVFSPEEVQQSAVIAEDGVNKKSTVGTISYMPPVFGCFCASAAINHLITTQ